MRYDNPDPDWYFEHVLWSAEPGAPRATVVGPAARWVQWWAAAARADSEAVRVAAAHGFVLAPGEVAALGITRSRSRNEVRQSRWTDAGHGWVAPVDVRDADPTASGRARARCRAHALRTSGAVLRRPRASASGRSAAILHGLPTMHVPSTPEVMERDVGDGRRSSAHVYPAALPRSEVSRWYGIDVETVGRTLVTLARHGRRDAIMAADAALREGLIDRAGIDRALVTAIGWPWVRQARSVLALADPRAESPLESITRLALHNSGFPEPELQVTFDGDRVDFYWAKYGVVLEADGDLKYDGDASLREKRRERRLLRQPGVRCIERVGWSDVVDTWPATSRDLRLRFR